MRLLNALAATLVIVGALNWGLVALAEFDLVAEIFGLEFGGLAGIYGIWALVAGRARALGEPRTSASH